MRRRELFRVGAVAVGVRALTLAAYLLASRHTSVLGYAGTLPVGAGESRPERLREIEGDLLERLAPYDGQFYLDIARRGYRRYEEWPWGNYAFLPLYPAALVALGGAGRGSVLMAVGLQVLLAGCAAAALWALAKRVGAPAWGAVTLYLAWPTSAFQVVAYPESLFLVLSLGATLFRLEGHERAAAAAGFLAGLTRTQGVLVGFLLLPRSLWGSRVGGGRCRREGTLSAERSGTESLLGRMRPRLPSVCPRLPGVRSWLRSFARKAATAGSRRIRPSDAAPLAPVFGYLGYLFLVAFAVGSPGGAFEIQRNWGRAVGPGGVFRAVGEILRCEGFRPDLVAAALGLGLLPVFFRRLPLPLALYGAGSVLLPLATGTTTSMGRFLSVAFPVYLALADVFRGRPRALGAVVLFLAALQVWFLRRLAAWEFVG